MARNISRIDFNHRPRPWVAGHMNQKDIMCISEQLCQFVRADFAVNGHAFDEHSLLADAGIDSYSLVELLLFSERTFGVTVPESHLTRENLASVATLAQCIAGLARSDTAPPGAPGL